MNYYAWKMRAPRSQQFSPHINIRHLWQLKKIKILGAILGLNSSANPAHLPQKWTKWAELAVLAVGNAFFVYLTFPIVWSVPISAIKKVLEFYIFCKVMEISKISLISSQQSFQFFKKSKKKRIINSRTEA